MFFTKPGRRTVLPFCMMAGAVLVLASRCFAESPAANAVQKMQNLYRSMHSYSAVFVVDTRAAAGPNKIIPIHVKIQAYYKAPNKFAQIINTNYTLNGKHITIKRMIISDGMHTTIYDSRVNKYAIQPAIPHVTPLEPAGIPFNLSTARVMGSVKLQGRPVYKISVTTQMPKLPPNVHPTAAQLKALLVTFVLDIDKANYHLLNFNAQNTNQEVLDQVINGAVADSHFHFVPPHGATRIVVPANGAPAKP